MMATLIGDVGQTTTHSPAHLVFSAPQSHQHQHQHQHQPTPSSTSTFASSLPSAQRRMPLSQSTLSVPSVSGLSSGSDSSSLPRAPPSSSSFSPPNSSGNSTAVDTDSSATASRIPTPPESSSPASTRDRPASQPHGAGSERDGNGSHMAPIETTSSTQAPSRGATATVTESAPQSVDSSAPTADSGPPTETAEPTPSAARPPPPTNAIPSPASEGYHHPWTANTSTSRSSSDYVPLPAGASLSAAPPSPPQPPRTQRTVHIRDLNHIENLAQLDVSTGNGPGILNDPPLQDMKFEISSMPIADIISMVAALLTKITTTNDRQHDSLNRNATQQRQAQAHNDGTEVHSSPLSTSVLAFHGKNVPAITIHSYLTRIHKYCPTTYEVFLSLLVYFDRMTERVNDLVVRDEESRRQRDSQRDSQRQPQRQGANHAESLPLSSASSEAQSQPQTSTEDVQMHDGGDEGSQGDEMDEGLADSDDDEAEDNNSNKGENGSGSGMADLSAELAPPATATYFVVDSFNIHRLIIAGVTCASKFFSDVFYTNSRYAKVGGLPLAELNHLELQFLILNDFRLAIPIEDLEAYATMLVEFYAREVVGQRTRPAANGAGVSS